MDIIVPLRVPSARTDSPIAFWIFCLDELLSRVPFEDRQGIDVRKTVSDRLDSDVELHTHLPAGQRPLSEVLGG
jgi:hypothetical protein